MRCRWGTRDCHLALALLIICVAFINIKHVIVSVDLGPRITVAATLNTLTLAVFRGQEYSRKVTSDQHHSVVICPMLSEPGIGLGGEYLCHSNNGSRSKSFLTLFTTMIYRKTKMQAFNRTLSLWPLLGPHVKLVLYLTPSGEREDEESYAPNLKVLATRACELGWDVLVAPLCNEYNYPVVSSMFLKSQQISESTWYGYANGDILFADNLMWTLRFLEKQNNTGVDFVVGRRSNVVVSVWILSSITFRPLLPTLSCLNLFIINLLHLLLLLIVLIISPPPSPSPQDAVPPRATSSSFLFFFIL